MAASACPLEIGDRRRRQIRVTFGLRDALARDADERTEEHADDKADKEGAENGPHVHSHTAHTTA